MPQTTHRDNLLTAGFELLYDHGYEETGVQQIVSACGVPKGSFYYYFDSKEAFALEVADRYLVLMQRVFDRHLVHSNGPYLERLRRLFEIWTRQAEQGAFRRGCLAGTLCQEMAAKNARFQSRLSQIFAESQSAFESCLRAAQEAGELSRSEDPDELAEFIINGWQGAMLRMKASKTSKPLERFRRLLFKKVLR